MLINILTESNSVYFIYLIGLSHLTQEYCTLTMVASIMVQGNTAVTWGNPPGHGMKEGSANKVLNNELCKDKMSQKDTHKKNYQTSGNNCNTCKLLVSSAHYINTLD